MSRLFRLPLHALPLLVLAALLIAAARSPWPPPAATRLLTTLGYLTAVAALWLDRRQAWFPVVLAGVALNGLVIIANGGRMPVASAALARLGGLLAGGVAAGADPRHVMAGPDTPLGFLGDRIALTAGGAGTILSPGDLLMAVGIAGALQAAMAAGPRAQDPGM